MNFSFDYYKNIENPIFYLCNPDYKSICALNAKNRNCVLRFNDISEITFDVPRYIGGQIESQGYDRIETKRLINIPEIGWFQITRVQDNSDGVNEYKIVTAQSHQTSFRDRGFYAEERVYKFYDAQDPHDDNYDSSNDASLPSIVGQLYQQLGIQVAIADVEFEPDHDYQDWTIIWIDPPLRFISGADSNICRTLKEGSATYGYDFMVNTASEAFEVMFLFDFRYHTIKVKTVENITQKTNIYLSFENLLKNAEITENAEDITTVLNCKGGDLDILSVNPTGSNYIVDFSYYMDEEKHQWMSQELIDKLKNWQIAVNDKKDNYKNLVSELSLQYEELLKITENKSYIRLKMSDLEKVRDQYIKDTVTTSDAVFVGEEVSVGGYSINDKSAYSQDSPFDSTIIATCYKEAPKSSQDGYFVFDDTQSRSGSLADNFERGYVYFSDIDPKTRSGNYCKLTAKTNGLRISWYYLYKTGRFEEAFANIGSYYTQHSKINENVVELMYQENSSIKELFDYLSEINVFDWNHQDNVRELVKLVKNYDALESESMKAEYDDIVLVSGFTRYVKYAVGTGNDQKSQIPTWIDIYSTMYNEVVNAEASQTHDIAETLTSMETISDELNIVNYFASTPNLLKELKCYWVEGEYTNDNLSVQDNMTQSEILSLATELYECGENELSRVAQPRFSISVDAINFIKLYKFKQFSNELELGKVITVEKSNGVQYFPALTELSFNFDDVDSSLSLVFSNALKLSDWGFTYADLITSSANTSRMVSANWRELTDYSNNKDIITDLLLNPLDETLRIAQKNLNNQEFVINNTGILGRRLSSEGSYEDEQIRLINNLILFTDDNWQTVRTALGKIKNSDGGESYGLLAEVLVGLLIMGNKLKIVDSDTNTNITIDGDGIAIKNIATGEECFKAGINGDVYVKGKISASTGDIAGFQINGNRIYTNFVGMASQDSTYNLAFWAGCTTLSNRNHSPFKVTHDGTLTSTRFVIEGDSTNVTYDENGSSVSKTVKMKIDNTGLYFRDGGSEIQISKCGLIVGDATFSSGVTGSTATQFHRGGILTYTVNDNGYFMSNGGNMVFTAQENFSMKPLNVYPTTGGLSSSGSTANIINLGDYGRIYLERLSNDDGGGIALSIAPINRNIRIGADGSYSHLLKGTWWCNGSTINTSDRNVKNTINDIDDKYETLFDGLRPVTYKYNSGNSGRLHIGFIAQEVDEALSKAGLTRQDCAAVCIDNMGTTSEHWGVRYEEFVALNTSEIQKLKRRIVELENIVKELKGVRG